MTDQLLVVVGKGWFRKFPIQVLGGNVIINMIDFDAAIDLIRSPNFKETHYEDPVGSTVFLPKPTIYIDGETIAGKEYRYQKEAEDFSICGIQTKLWRNVKGQPVCAYCIERKKLKGE